MKTKRISLVELKSLVKKIITEESKTAIELTPLYTKRDKRGYRFYSANNGTVLYAEKDGVIYNVNDDLKPTGRASIAHEKDSEKFTGLVNDKDIQDKPDGYYEKQTIGRVRNNFKM